MGAIFLSMSERVILGTSVIQDTATGSANDVAMDIIGRARVRQRSEEATETTTNSAQETFNRFVAQKAAMTIVILLCLVV